MRQVGLTVALSLALAGVLAACGSGGAALPASGAPLAPARPARAAQPARGVASSARTSVSQASSATAKAMPAVTSASQGGAQLAGSLPPLPPISPMVIKNGSLSLEVQDPESSLSQVDRIVHAAQGFISSQSVVTRSARTFVNLTIEVPADSFETTMGQLRGLRASGSAPLNDTVNAQDVTQQYVDLQAEYQNLQASRDAYQRLLNKATAVADIITLTQELATIQTRMDQITSRQRILSRQAAMSTITLSLAPVGANPVIGPRPLPGPVQAAQEAWQALLTGLRGLAVVLIWMGILLPIPAAIVGGGWLAYRRLSRSTVSSSQ